MSVWKAFAGAIIRWLLVLMFAPLVAKNVIGQDLFDSVTSEGVAEILAWSAVLVPLLWSLWAKIKSKLKFDTALAAPAGTSSAEVAAIVEQKPVTEKVVEALRSEGGL